MRSAIILAVCLVAVALGQSSLNFPSSYTATVWEVSLTETARGTQSENKDAVYFNGTVLPRLSSSYVFTDLTFFANGTNYFQRARGACASKPTTDRPISYFNTRAKSTGKKCTGPNSAAGNLWSLTESITQSWTICASADGTKPLYFLQRVPAIRTEFTQFSTDVKDTSVFQLSSKCYKKPTPTRRVEEEEA
eukprot:TRINITY_DN15132_c0_g1_i4.p1 TRINITY_DN15132_c0_g1~~TRINITY_DN15132_c0_g1_i4.p1  ORF type:complete len:192 (-),score=48.29 TRINITY_DN15132_c0_g1_i4:233-808(-)